MANLIGIAGPSGFGKSTSIFKSEELKISGLDPKETGIINVTGKPLPVKGANKLYPLDKKITDGGNHVITEDPEKVSKIIDYISNNRTDIKNLIIDDAGYLMGLEAINKSKVKGFDKWVDLAVNFMKVVNSARNARYDLNIIFIFHTEIKDNITKIKTAGAMIDNTIFLDGLFTTILYSELEPSPTGESVTYKFRTHSDGVSTCKTPAGMFKEDLIPNDMGYVLKKMNEYYN